MKQFSLLLLLSLLLLAGTGTAVALVNEYNPQSVGAGNPELYIKSDGAMTLKGARVEQIVGTTFFLGLKWGELPMRFTMKTDARTTVTKRYGGDAVVAQINLSDYLDVEGAFFSGSDFFGVSAVRIKDWSLQEEAGTFTGVITDVQPGVFTLRTTKSPGVMVRMATSSTITKGNVTISFERLRKGDAILFAGGVYDYSKNTLTADKITVYQNKVDFLSRNFEGKIKEIVSATVPATIIVTVGNDEYSVKINEKTAVQKKNKSPAQLARFVIGDTVRFYGAVREEDKTLTDNLIVDASIVRNLNL